MGGPKTVGLTEREKEFLDAYIRYGGHLTQTAKALGISVSTASGLKFSSQSKYFRAKEIMREFEYYKMRAPSVLGV